MLRIVTLCLWLAGLSASAATRVAALKITDTRLDNGLRVLIAEDRSAPVFSIAVTYNVGSRDEKPGRTGFAHLFEHMMFKGSEKVGPGEHFFLVFNNGGNMNGTTNADRTLYFEMLPANQLDLALFLESDRMRSLAITKENLDNQRQAVQEERRLRVDNVPYGASYEKTTELAYDNFAYKHSTIGSMEDLNAASIEDVQEFFRIYYAPNNAALALVGDLDTAGTLARVRKFFGTIPRQASPKPPDLSEGAQTGERRATLDDKLARLARVEVNYKVPPAGDPDMPALEILSSILSAGQSSRLYQKMVKETEVAVQAGGFVGRRAGPGLYALQAIVRPGKTPAQILGVLDEEIARLHAAPVTGAELKRARSSALRRAVDQRGSTLQIAVRLADDAVMFNDPVRLNTDLDRLLAVTAEDVSRVARQYLRAANRSVIITQPAGPPPMKKK